MPLAFAACEETQAPEPTPTPGPESPELYLVSNGVQYFEAAGGEGDIEYRLENAEGAPQHPTREVQSRETTPAVRFVR